MQLNSLKIEKKRYGTDMGKILAKVECGNDIGEITLQLSEEATMRILAVAADELISATACAAEEFRQTLQTALLPSPANVEVDHGGTPLISPSCSAVACPSNPVPPRS